MESSYFPHIEFCRRWSDRATKLNSDGASGDAVCDSSVPTTAQHTDNKDSIWIMLLISVRTGPFSVGACPWSLCTAAIDTHTHAQRQGCHPSLRREKGTSRPRQMHLSVFFPPLFISSAMIRRAPAENHSVQTGRIKWWQLCLSCTWCHLKRAIEERSENPVETRAAGNPLSAAVLAH